MLQLSAPWQFWCQGSSVPEASSIDGSHTSSAMDIVVQRSDDFFLSELAGVAAFDASLSFRQGRLRFGEWTLLAMQLQQTEVFSPGHRFALEVETELDSTASLRELIARNARARPFGLTVLSWLGRQRDFKLEAVHWRPVSSDPHLLANWHTLPDLENLELYQPVHWNWPPQLKYSQDFSISVPASWQPYVQWLIDELGCWAGAGRDFTLLQVKEKLGSLRIRAFPHDSFIESITDRVNAALFVAGLAKPN